MKTFIGFFILIVFFLFVIYRLFSKRDFKKFDENVNGLLFIVELLSIFF